VSRPLTRGRRLLLFGFGGLLVLILLAGADALVVLGKVRTSDAQARNVDFRRSRALDQVRAGIYQSAIVMRDYLLAGDRDTARAQVEKGASIRQRTDAALAECAAAINPAEAAPFRSLQAEMAVYWKLLDFIAELQEKDKRNRGAAYFSTELVRRREAMLELVDRDFDARTEFGRVQAQRDVRRTAAVADPGADIDSRGGHTAGGIHDAADVESRNRIAKALRGRRAGAAGVEGAFGAARFGAGGGAARDFAGAA
jgi:hypothetical protein